MGKLLFALIMMSGVAFGAVARLVAIIPAAGFVGVAGALVIGIGGSIVGLFGVIKLKKIFDYDDSLDAFGVHYLAGAWGAIATGFFALQSLAWSGSPMQHGDRIGQIIIQLKSIAITTIYTAIMTVVVFYVVSLLTGGARVDEDTETAGLDEAIHSEKGFELK
jgi:Amt family ammonium transporter